MRLPINIDDVLHGQTVEWERLEFKQGWNPEAVVHTMCAFANDFHNLGSGYVFIGVEENQGQPVLPPAGMPASKLDGIQKEILEIGHSQCATDVCRHDSSFRLTPFALYHKVEV